MRLFLFIGSCLLIFSLSAQILDQTDSHIFQSSFNQSETHISICKRFPNTILVSSNIDDANPNNGNNDLQGYYYSVNNGLTWTGQMDLPFSDNSFGDPVTLFDANGNYYLIGMVDYLLLGSGNYRVYKSIDGQNWQSFTSNTDYYGAYMDKQMAVLFDDLPTSPFANNFYCAFTSITDYKVMFNSSNNNFQSFTPPINLSGNNTGQGTTLDVGSNGEIVVAWANYGPNKQPPASSLGFAVSFDGGQNFTTSTPFNYNGIRTNLSLHPSFNSRINDFPSLTVDRSCGVNNNRVYVAYSDLLPNGNSEIKVRFSDNFGSTFSNPISISLPNLNQAFFPWIKCDPSSGLVVVQYLSIEDEDFKSNTYVAYSIDGGQTFNNIKVSDESHNRSPISGSYCGDYNAIDVFNGISYSSWSDNRNGVWQVYVSKLDFTNIIPNIQSTSYNQTFNNFNFNSNNYIFQANNIEVLGNSVFTNASKSILRASNSITIKPNTIIQNGADAEIYINPFNCSNYNSKTYLNNQNQELQSEIDDRNYQVFPNPSEGIFTISSSIPLTKVSVFNVFGVLVKQFDVPLANETILNCAELSAGLYYVNSQTKNNDWQTQKIIIK